MDRRTARSNEAYGSMGRKQEEQAKALFPLLEERMRQALRDAGWRVIGQTPFQIDIWHYYGTSIIEKEQQLEHLARRVWHGSYPRQGAEKMAPLSDMTLLSVFPQDQWHPINDHLELVLYPETRQIHVRRRRKEGSTQEQERTPASNTVAVVGSGAAPAFYRERATRPVSFTCQWCTKTVTQQRYPGPLPSYCSETCEQEAQREKTERRVQQLRARRKIKE
jgi:hypothetical protein